MPLILQDPCETIVWLCVSVRAQLIQLFALPWTVAHQAPLSTGFSRPESWSGLPFPSPGDLPISGIEPGIPALPADFFFTIVWLDVCNYSFSAWKSNGQLRLH